MLCSIQFLNCPTLAKTVKACLMSHLGDPQLTAPCNVHELLLFWQTNGPPESPWQPDWLAETSVFPAHNIWSVIGTCFPFLREQVDWSWMVIASCWRMVCEPPGCLIFPHPKKKFQKRIVISYFKRNTKIVWWVTEGSGVHRFSFDVIVYSI